MSTTMRASFALRPTAHTPSSAIEDHARRGIEHLLGLPRAGRVALEVARVLRGVALHVAPDHRHALGADDVVGRGGPLLRDRGEVVAAREREARRIARARTASIGRPAAARHLAAQRGELAAQRPRGRRRARPPPRPTRRRAAAPPPPGRRARACARRIPAPCSPKEKMPWFSSTMPTVRGVASRAKHLRAAAAPGRIRASRRE